MRITVGNIKGGVAKTTTAVFLALDLARNGDRVLLVDADPEQASALMWSEEAAEKWPENCSVVAISTRDLGKRAGGIAKDFDHLIIDTSPKNPLLLRQALSITDTFVVPVAPRPMETSELPMTFALAEEVKALHHVDVVVLLVQVRRGTRSGVETRAVLNEMKLPVLTSETHLHEAYALAFGTVPEDIREYIEIGKELRTLRNNVVKE